MSAITQVISKLMKYTDELIREGKTEDLILITSKIDELEKSAREDILVPEIELAEEWDVAQGYVQEQRRKGILKAVKLGKSHFYRRSSIDEYLEMKEEENARAIPLNTQSRIMRIT